MSSIRCASFNLSAYLQSDLWLFKYERAIELNFPFLVLRLRRAQKSSFVLACVKLLQFQEASVLYKVCKMQLAFFSTTKIRNFLIESSSWRILFIFIVVLTRTRKTQVLVQFESNFRFWNSRVFYRMCTFQLVHLPKIVIGNFEIKLNLNNAQKQILLRLCEIKCHHPCHLPWNGN